MGSRAYKKPCWNESGSVFPVASCDSVALPSLEPDNNETLVSDRRQGKESGLWNRKLIIAAETVLFPPLAEDPSSHFYTHRLRHTRAHTHTRTHTQRLGT